MSSVTTIAFYQVFGSEEETQRCAGGWRTRADGAPRTLMVLSNALRWGLKAAQRSAQHLPCVTWKQGQQDERFVGHWEMRMSISGSPCAPALMTGCIFMASLGSWGYIGVISARETRVCQCAGGAFQLKCKTPMYFFSFLKNEFLPSTPGFLHQIPANGELVIYLFFPNAETSPSLS